MTPHRIVNPDSLSRPVGFSHAVIAGAGRTVYLGGQTAHDADGAVQGDDLAAQFDYALGNVVTALAEAGAAPEHLVSLHVYTTDVDAYRASLAELGVAWRRHMGRHYPAMALFGVTDLFDAATVVELVGVAVVPDADSSQT